MVYQKHYWFFHKHFHHSFVPPTSFPLLQHCRRLLFALDKDTCCGGVILDLWLYLGDNVLYLYCSSLAPLKTNHLFLKKLPDLWIWDPVISRQVSAAGEIGTLRRPRLFTSPVLVSQQTGTFFFLTVSTALLLWPSALPPSLSASLCVMALWFHATVWVWRHPTSLLAEGKVPGSKLLIQSVG